MMHRTAPWDAVWHLPAMSVGVRTQADKLSEIAFLPLHTAERAPRNGLAAKVIQQLERYQLDPDAPFDLPLAEAGTVFRRRVWACIASTPRGRTQTYGEIARALRSSARAVGQACGDNPYPIVIPCHRVVSAQGLGGFAHQANGALIEAKRWLLAHEGVHH